MMKQIREGEEAAEENREATLKDWWKSSRANDRW